MKRGSALLVVLGMVSFMVISAVAFSALMRYSRLPSSYLRRTSASRHLAHAAVAKAIDIIDVSIGENPHPGFGDQSSTYPRKTGWSCNRNWWRNNCFIGTNQLVSADETVSTLTLEGLAYIPPSLVNEARYYSRHAESARWQDLGYDSGRFAFFAIDVSDCLNLNRVPGNFARSSADNGKLSLASAFENADHTGYTVKPSAWDTFMDNYVDFDKVMEGVRDTSVSKMPLVSLADLNLAAYAKGGSLANYISPFCNYILNGTEFVTSETGPEAEIMRSLNIITDGYYPSMAVTDDEDGDLSNPRQQPFTSMRSGSSQAANREILSLAGTGTGRMLEETMTGIDMISLYDYLDENDIPASLALPSVERVPMICGLQSALQLTLKPSADTAENPPKQSLTDVGQSYVETTTCKLEVQALGGFSSLFMFPFQRDKDALRSGYSSETALRICFGVEAPGLRTAANSSYVLQQDGDFSAEGVVNAAICPKVTAVTPSFSSVIRPEDAFDKKDATVTFNNAMNWFKGNPLFTVMKTFVAVSKDPESGTLTFKEDESKRAATISADFHPVGKDGTGNGGFTEDLLKAGGSVIVRPYMSILTRVKSNGKTVDLVPACAVDDKKYNAINSDVNIININGSGNNTPIMTFAGDKDITFGLEAFQKGEQIQVQIQPTGGGSVFCPDPRWNFAPEDFMRTTKTLDNLQGQNFLNVCGIGLNGRDRDIFMFASNQGYMQSPAELAFLPRTVTDLVDGGGTKGNKMTGNCTFAFDKTDFEVEGNIDTLPHGGLMWRTYRLYPQNGLGRDSLYDLGLFDGGRGARVNPYASSTYGVLAALANTPYSWWAASTNYNSSTYTGKANVPDDAESFNKEYAFSEMNEDAKIKWEDLKKIAVNLQSAMRANPNGNWVAGWDSLDWCGDEDNFCGVALEGETCELYDVDRKFLYGYWRDCFAAKQQLFLVFVRAEPMMMGGGSVGQTPPQLGARAVALVWRNPAPGTPGNIVGGYAARLADFKVEGSNIDKADANAPHRTRILFYRQFD